MGIWRNRDISTKISKQKYASTRMRHMNIALSTNESAYGGFSRAGSVHCRISSGCHMACWAFDFKGMPHGLRSKWLVLVIFQVLLVGFILYIFWYMQYAIYIYTYIYIYTCIVILYIIIDIYIYTCTYTLRYIYTYIYINIVVNP